MLKKCSITISYPNYSETHEWNKLKKHERLIVFYVEKNGMLVSERVNGTEHESSHQSTEEGAPQRFQWKIVTDLQS